MNFFGHAVIARRQEAARGNIRAEFVLGSMLPDFASMLRARPPKVTRAVLAEGIRFHHATDDAFHGCGSFLEFSRQASHFLLDRGVPRGSARAVAHVGVELVLDAALAQENASNEAYLCALDCALTKLEPSHITWEASDDETRFQHLCHTLFSRGKIRSDFPAELVAQRLRNILSGRPRLALDDATQIVVRDWLVVARPMIVSRADELVSEVEQRLRIGVALT